MKILVVGDFMLDRYWLGTAERVSPEAPCLIVKVQEVFSVPGGAANVYANLEALGAELPRLDVELDNIPIKNRLQAGDVQLVRWDERDSCKPMAALPDVGVDRIVIADYGKGTITDSLLLDIYKRQLPTFVDTKGDPAKYVGWITAIFPNAKEYQQYKGQYDLFDRCVLKLGGAGIAQLEFGKVKQTLPSYSDSPVSVNGAGDSVIAAYAVRWPAKDALRFANLAAAVAVEKPYTATVSLDEITAMKRKLRRNSRKK